MSAMARQCICASLTVAACLFFAAHGLAGPPDQGTGDDKTADRDIAAELDAQRLIGKAYYENAETPPQFMPAANVFRHCIELAPDSAVDRFNLGLCLMRGEKFEEALQTLNEARRLDPDLLAASYVTGIVYKRLSKADEAIEHLKHVTARDPKCMGAYYNLGVCYKLNEDYEKAIEAFKRAVELNPNHPSCHLQLMTLYRRLGDVENVKRHKEIFDLVKDTVDESEKTAEALERSRYSYIIEAPKLTSDLVPNPGAKIRFVDVTAQAGLGAAAKESDRPTKGLSQNCGTGVSPVSDHGQEARATGELGTGPKSPPASLPITFKKDEYSEEKARDRYVPTVGGAVSLGDFDSDGDLDIYVVHCAATPEASANRLYQNDGGWRFKDVTDVFGVGDTGMGMEAVFGDFDHDDGGSVELEDGNLDLYIVNDGPNVLYRKQGHGVLEVSGLQTEADTGVAVLKLAEPLPTMLDVGVDATAIETADHHHNAFMIFDYQGPDDFKFAGADMDAGVWVIGHYDGSWVSDAQFSEGLAVGKTYPLRLRLKGGSATLIHINAGAEDKKVSHDFGKPVTGGLVGLAARHAVTRFDKVTVREFAKPDAAPETSARDLSQDSCGTGVSPVSPPPRRRCHNGLGLGSKLLYEEDFKDGVADRFEAISGTWEVVDWKYEDISEQARVQEPQFGRKAVFVDYDHDFDLDIFVVNNVDLFAPPDRETFAVPTDFGGQFNTLLRNNGNRTFSVQTDEAQLLVDCSQTVDVLFTDFDDDTDTDLFIVNADTPSILFLNARLGKFEPGGSFSPSLKEGGRAAAERDFNRDGTPDLLFAVGNELYLYINDGKAGFTGTSLDLPGALVAGGGVGRIDVCDYNNDGWADLLLAGTDGRALGLLAGTGPARFGDVTSIVGLDGNFGQIADLAVADLDGDGDEDIALLTRDRGLRLLKNDGGEQAHWVNVCLIGKKVNRNGYGALVEIARGGHYQKQTAADGWVHFGLGNLDGIDVIRVTWPNGQAQNVVSPPINTDLPFVQYVKVSASCGFLYANGGPGFELVNEILGIGPLGAPMAPGVYFPLDHTELTKIESHQLVPKDGAYELRLTEELREITYADQITLRVVDHPAELEIIPNEKFSFPPPEDRFFAVCDHRSPVSAVDDRGIDVLPLVLERDGRFPTFPLVEQYDGLAEPHALTLDLGDLSAAEQIMLYLDGWIYWAEASVSTAIFQDPRYEVTPLKLEVRDEQGQWHTAVESVGLPTSKGIVVPVDLTDRFPCDDYHVRLSTTMRVYFDRIFVSSRDEASRCRITELPVAQANVHFRGFSRLTRDEFGFERFDYADASPTGSWNPPAGFYTRYGDVTPLLASPDDMYVIFGPGDELTMRFDAASLPVLPAGWTRDFIFYADGWVKDGDLNTALSETVGPLPFHEMSGYPYPSSEHYPDTPELNRYRRAYNTRPSRPTVGCLPAAQR
ncbi:MAG: VCBS repeat-containing protein [Phycisphaerae bacterium]|nr:VCBS repeat-containing protein [Phycisphaerae bacterium]